MRSLKFPSDNRNAHAQSHESGTRARSNSIASENSRPLLDTQPCGPATRHTIGTVNIFAWKSFAPSKVCARNLRAALSPHNPASSAPLRRCALRCPHLEPVRSRFSCERNTLMRAYPQVDLAATGGFNELQAILTADLGTCSGCNHYRMRRHLRSLSCRERIRDHCGWRQCHHLDGQREA
jgi:hypothetical protein